MCKKLWLFCVLSGLPVWRAAGKSGGWRHGGSGKLKRFHRDGRFLSKRGELCQN